MNRPLPRTRQLETGPLVLLYTQDCFTFSGRRSALSPRRGVTGNVGDQGRGGGGWWGQGGPCRQHPPASPSQPCPLIKVVLSPKCGFLGPWPQWGRGGTGCSGSAGWGPGLPAGNCAASLASPQIHFGTTRFPPRHLSPQNTDPLTRQPELSRWPRLSWSCL